MKTHTLTTDSVLLELTTQEHIALSNSLSDLVTMIEPCELEAKLGWTADAVYEFAYSVYIEEALGRMSGIEWLPMAGCSDSLVFVDDVYPLLEVRFWEGGAIWKITNRQYEFIATCVAARRELAEQA